LDAMWERLSSCPEVDVEYPDPLAMFKDFQANDYTALLKLEGDLKPPGIEKVICAAGGVVAPVQLQWYAGAEQLFSGMFRGADYGLIRCSSVTEPIQPSRLSLYPAIVPMVALKFFRDGAAQSSNVVLAHKKSGHKNPNFLAHAVSNHFTENIVYPFKEALKVFYKYSSFPTFTGCSEFCSRCQDGSPAGEPRSPYALVLLAPASLRARKIAPTKHLLDQFRELSAGDLLFEVFAVPEPMSMASSLKKQPPQIWRVGELRLCAPFVASQLGDRKLFFRHHLFEEDLKLRPDWADRADRMLGAPVYEELIEAGKVLDVRDTAAPARPPAGS